MMHDFREIYIEILRQCDLLECLRPQEILNYQDYMHMCKGQSC